MVAYMFLYVAHRYIWDASSFRYNIICERRAHIHHGPLVRNKTGKRVMHGVDLLLPVLSSLAQQEVSGSLLGSATEPSHDLGSDP